MIRRAVILAALALTGCGTTTTAERHGDRDCSDFADQAAAQERLDAHPGDPDKIDGDGNGVACESLGVTKVSGAAAPGPTRRARVISVIDGDTIKVSVADGARETVRLVGIDTPESRRPQTSVECGAKRAAAQLRGLLTGQAVTLRRDPTQDGTDRYGRTLAYVDLAGSRDAGEFMVRGGWAKPYVYRGVPFQRLAAYRAAESTARRGRAGVHGACGSDFHRRA